MSIEKNISEIKEKVYLAAQRSGRKSEDITIVAATKTVAPERIQEAVNEGIINIGENRVQELLDKYGKVENGIWHFIGHLQTNKVKYIVDKASLIHSVESERLLDEIEKTAGKMNTTAHVLIELNASGEESKFGIGYDDVMPIIENNEKRNHVKIDGLMTIGPNVRGEERIRKVFQDLYKLYLDIGQKKYYNSSMQFLSMGMSGDYEIAIEEGSNMVRIGTAIFGLR